MKKYDFDKGVERRGTDAKKFDPKLVGCDVTPMWIADTDFPCPEAVVDAVCKRADLGHYGYPYINKAFERACARWEKERFGWEVDEEWVEYSPGVMPAAIYAIRAFSNPGDKVLLQTPVYPPFYAVVENNGRRIVKNSLKLVNGRYEIDFDDLEKKLDDTRLKIMMLCNPQNPTGRCFTYEELLRIGELCEKYNVFVISDEIHQDLVFRGHKHIPFASIKESFAMNSITAISPSKTFNTAGLRTAAWIAPNPEVKKAVYEQVVNNKAYGRNIFGDAALIAAYTASDDYMEELMEYLNDTRDEVIRYFKEYIPKIKLIKPEATYLFWLDCKELGFATQQKLKDFVYNEGKMYLNDGTTFGTEGFMFMRLNIAMPRRTVMEALDRLKKAVDALL